MKILYSLCKTHALQIFNPKAKHNGRKLALFGFLILLGAFYLFAYCFFIAKFLNKAGLLSLLPPSVFTICSLLCLMTSVYRVEGALIHAGDDTLLNALPLQNRTIILSRFIVMYIENLAIFAACFIPCIVAMNYFGHLDLAFYLRLLILIPFAPLLSMVLGMLIGLMIQIISRRFRNSHFINIFLTFALIFAIYYYSFKMGEMKNIDSLAMTITSMLTNIYPLSKLFVNFLMDSQITALLSYFLIQVLSGIVFIQTASLIKDKNFTFKQKAIKTKIKAHSCIMTLYKKEIKRYINSVPYVTNTAVMDVLLIGLCIFLQFQDLDNILTLLEMTGFKSNITNILPIMVGLMVGMSTTTASSIATEGKHLWQLKALPIPPIKIFISKIMVNLTLSIPTILISTVLLTNALHLNMKETGLLLVIPTLNAFLYSQAGLIANLFFPHLHWDSEMKAVKQGVATLIIVFTAMGTGMIPIGLIQAGFSTSTIISILGIILIVLNLACAFYLYKYAPQKFHQI